MSEEPILLFYIIMLIPFDCFPVIIHYQSYEVSIRAKQFHILTTAESREIV